MAKVFIVYYSRTGNTGKMANAVAEGAREGGATDVVVKRAQDVCVDELSQGDAFAFGSPTYFSYMAGWVQTVLEEAYLARSKFSGKPFAAFASGAGGEVQALESVERVCRAVGLKRYTEGVTSAGAPDAATLARCRELGRSLAAAGAK